MRGTVAKRIRKRAYAGEHGVTPKNRTYNFSPRVDPNGTRCLFVRDRYTDKVLERREAEVAFIQEHDYFTFLQEFYDFYDPIHVSRPINADMYRRSYRTQKKEYTAGEQIWKLEYQNSPEAKEWRGKVGRS